MAVDASVKALRATGVSFSIQDVADHAGISRASLYRIAGLRERIGNAGELPHDRPVSASDLNVATRSLARVRTERSAAVKENRRLAVELARSVRRVQELLLTIEETTQTLRSTEHQAASTAHDKDTVYGEGFQAGLRASQQKGRALSPMAGAEDLNSVAARLPRQQMLKARRKLALAIHPDLYHDDLASQLLASELFKLLNQLASPSDGTPRT